MTAEERNTEFLKHQGLIDLVIRRNYTLLKALQLDIEDVKQDLSIRILRQIEKYDSERSACMSTYLSYCLQYEILNIKKKHKPHGITGYGGNGKLQFLYLDQVHSGCEHYELPVYDDKSGCEAYELFASLSDSEIEALKFKIKGFHSREKEDKKALANIGKRYMEIYNQERGMAA